MTGKNLERLPLFRGLLEGIFTTKEVAKRLDLSENRVRQLKKAFLEQGERALTHGNLGRRPVNSIKEELKAHIVSLKKSAVYNEVSFANFRRMLDRQHNINISYTALSDLLKKAGFLPKTKRKKARYFKRKGALGERLGTVAHFHDWFGDGIGCVLHGFVDDATRCITGLYFCRDECVKGYIEVLRQTITNYGVPLELFSKKAGTLFGTPRQMNSLTDDEMSVWKPPYATPLGLIVVERLGIDVMDDTDASCAQKRVEHLRSVLQKRLLRWLKRMGIIDMEQANRELHRYMTLFNNRFANKPRILGSSFVPLGDHDLDMLLAVRHEHANYSSLSDFSFLSFT
ncbi:MAG: hypothetical protein FWB78_08415 [Treponema sp.]|nr:hypothetical protein [Treponema sp.]